jgi:hypothetical protein
MTSASIRTVGILALTACLTLTICAGPLQAQDQAALTKILADKAPLLVTVKFVLKMKMGNFGEQENETEVTGTMISPEGLVLCSNTSLGGFMGLISRFAGQDFSAQPTDLKVLVGDDNQGVEAEFIARDTELDLAWIRIKKPDKKYTCLDLAKAARPAVGDPILCVHRMDKYFDRTAVVSEGRIGGITKKPRELFVPTTGSSADMGVPVYTPAGELIGLTIIQTPDTDEASANPMSMISRMSGLRDMGNLILPAAEVAKATKRALETAKTTPADESGATSKPAAPKAAKPRTTKPKAPGANNANK